MTTNQPMARLKSVIDTLSDPQAGSIVSARNRQALDTTMDRFRADELTEAFVANMVRRFGVGITEHHIKRELGKHK